MDRRNKSGEVICNSAIEVFVSRKKSLCAMVAPFRLELDQKRTKSWCALGFNGDTINWLAVSGCMNRVWF